MFLQEIMTKKLKDVAPVGGCDYCLDPNGDNCYPWYGLRPHSHDLSVGGFLGSTVIDKSLLLPPHFKPDLENDNFGTYTHCPKCGCHA